MKPEYSKELLAEMWKKLNLAREFETRVQWLFSMGLVHGTTHLGIGEEATAVGSILALKPQITCSAPTGATARPSPKASTSTT